MILYYLSKTINSAITRVLTYIKDDKLSNFVTLVQARIRYLNLGNTENSIEIVKDVIKKQTTLQLENWKHRLIKQSFQGYSYTCGYID